MLEIGIKGSQKTQVSEDNTAITAGSGILPVFATPAMVALMEKTCWKSVAPYLQEGESTVGISLNISHLSATPLGMEVTCESTLVQVDGRKLTFKVEAYDEAGKIGEGSHERFIVISDKFMKKAKSKISSEEQ